jgi:hypothetical protein
MPEILSPDDGRIGCGMERFGDTFMDCGHKRDQDEWEEDKREEKKAVTPDGDEAGKNKKGNPGDASIGEEQGNENESEIEPREKSSTVLPGIDEEIHSCHSGYHKEIEAEDIGMTEGTKDASGRNIFIREADTEDKLVDTEKNRKDAGDKNCHEEKAVVAVALNSYIGHETDDEKIKNAERFLE